MIQATPNPLLIASRNGSRGGLDSVEIEKILCAENAERMGYK